MKRVAFKMHLKSGCEVEYEKRHKEIWSELVALLKDTGTSDYSIFWDKETNILFAVQRLTGNKSANDLANEPIVQKWWAYMADILDSNADNSPVTVELNEIFHLG